MLKTIGFLLCLLSSTLKADPVPLVSVGGGYFEAGRHSDGFFQIEYKWGKYFWHRIRPEVGIMSPGFCSLFIYGGLAIELYCSEHIVLSPNFTPGFYMKGSGRDLGFPIEFRSALEIAYEFLHGGRMGFQFYHISNAHLGSHNPGANAYALFIAYPL